MAGEHSFGSLQAAFAAQPLFEHKTWRFSPQPWPLTGEQIEELRAIGDACLEFHRAAEFLYLRSGEGRNLLRNAHLEAPWVADYLDRGKPEVLLRHARHPHLRRAHPLVIRPDLLVTETGFALTEIDSVPGGIGLTAFLNSLYGADPSVLGADGAMLDRFYQALCALRPELERPLIVIAVSDEASTYRPEMDWLAAQYQAAGKRVYAIHPDDLFPLGDTLCADIDGDPEEVDIIYRFWELFDLANIPVAQPLMARLEAGEPIAVTPPMRHFHEEKLNLALFHHPRLAGFWREQLSRTAFKLLHRIIPKGWVMDPAPLPANAVLHAPNIGGVPIIDWHQLGHASQRERDLILKLSGYHENAWGARSVLYGRDASRDEWLDGLNEALAGAKQNLYILQEYRKPARLRHPVYSDSGRVEMMDGRVRLCPYYFAIGEQTELAGCLATFCPSDKKIIHGMRDAALLPVKCVDP